MAEMLQFNIAEGKASLIKTNDEGYVTHENVVVLATSFDSLADFLNATAIVEGLGFDTGNPDYDLEKSDDGELAWLQIAPKPMPVSFVGYLPDNALDLAKSVGVPALALLNHDDLDPDNGRVRAYFSVSAPRGFEWQTTPEWEWLVSV